MEWHYYTNKATKRKIDFLLEEAAIIFANCDNSYAAKKEAQEKEQEILSKINSLDPHFAESCGYRN
tara:strand:+ start:445 stop:642 length:198 start_codon:yes stop_codon:yes gene_type:complete